MRQKPASVVLASLKASTYHRARAAGAAQGGRVRKFTPQPLGHWALTNSRPSADVTLLIHRVADLAAALSEERFHSSSKTLLVRPIEFLDDLLGEIDRILVVDHDLHGLFAAFVDDE